ncbi:hypothetical protein Q9R19_07315 [Microbacterium sp. ARD32]|uniref:FtsX-like permease family protein n=1 Tax=Microbacterium sp. ARD32 TaxID=2962577 RepID=UPI002881B91E|nr:FtsX-like permease family protein [Microbacterium sp. ARD32]MDT0157428.1 hypothetical protein [Microbacterium sp. ARD32]
MAFTVRRARQHVGRLSLIALLVALLVAGIGGLDAVAGRLLASGATLMFTDAEPQARTILVTATVAPDSAAQDETIRDSITTAFAGTDVVVSRRTSAAVDLTTSDGPEVELTMLHDDRLQRLATLTAGDWPASATQIALPAAAADRLGAAVGDPVLLTDGAELTLVGIWTPEDPLDPAWLGDPSVVSGQSDRAIGPAIAVDAALTRFADAITATWEIAPVAATPAAVPALQHAIDSLRTVPNTIDPYHQYSTEVSGGLGDILRRVSVAISSVRGLLAVPLLILALLGALVLGVVQHTLTDARTQELALLRARGASARRLALLASGESAAVAAVGAIIALIVLVLAGGMTPTAPLTAAAAVVFVAAASALFTLRRAGGADSIRAEAQRSDAGLRTLPTLLLPAGIAVVLAALSCWQLFAAGGVSSDEGRPDPLASVAPALLLVAACSLVPILAAPLAAIGERLLRRTRGIAPILPLRQIARRMGGVAVAILCLALASASAAVAITAPAEARAAERHSRSALLGSDVRLISDTGLDVRAEDVEAWDGVTGAAEVLRTTLTIGSDNGTILAGPREVAGLAPRRAGSGTGVPAEITRSLADRLAAGVGTVFTGKVRFAAEPVQFRVVRIVESLPSVGDGIGAAVEMAQLQAAGALVPPDELWVDSDHPAATARQLRTHATNPVRILTAAQVSAAPVTSVAPTALTAGALAAAVLGAVGFLAACSALIRARRGERDVLRSLGLSPRRRALLQTGEIAGLAVYAVAAGAALGVAVAAVTLPLVLGGAA